MVRLPFSRDREQADEIATRLRRLRLELYGMHGGPLLAEDLDLPFRAWQALEQGDEEPARVLDRLVEVTGVSPLWLHTGLGPMLSWEGD
ncbi:hypothetical protein [Tautonia sociabilis]|uniref:XRE family transcriptional regulator n=1 Tax=Tautonia sociabilis TaxID=2080755 RepID=A0A432MCQ9_9BACT|nr:hypothetical protein [Tautonia sociabilis]RUL82005.1 hypothetical protein TsocGM_24175 [Tautonia sociabilis]